jgi:hypothetical protein
LQAPTRQGGKGKRGRPKKAGEQTAAQKRTEPSKQAGSKGKPGRKSSSRVEKHNATLNTKSSRAVAPRRQLQEADIEAQDEIAPDATATTAAKRTVKRPEYVSLEAKTRRIPQNVISKWPVISASVVDQITVLLKHAKDAVALSRRDPQKQMEADELLHGVIQQLGRHLSGMKIPPRAKAQHFDIDQLTTRNEGLLYALTTERDKNKLLKDKITETETRLEREEETLKEARANAQQWHREWRNREKKQVSKLVPKNSAEYLAENSSSILYCNSRRTLPLR